MVVIRKNNIQHLSSRRSSNKVLSFCGVLVLVTVAVFTWTTVPSALKLSKSGSFLEDDPKVVVFSGEDCHQDQEIITEPVDPTIFPIQHALQLAQQSPSSEVDIDDDDDRFRVLLIISTLAEYDSGGRGTKAGSDRLQKVVIPTIQGSVEKMKDWHIDVFLILGYEKLRPERYQLIRDALPSQVKNIHVWEDAIPLFYSDRRGASKNKVETASHGLSRQHRFVIKDQLENYDFFMAFEDDMKVTYDHVMNFLELSSMIEQFTHDSANPNSDSSPEFVFKKQTKRDVSHDGAKVGNDVAYDSNMTTEQWKRVFPGLLRVEVNIHHPHPSNGGLKVDQTFPQKEHIPAHPSTPDLTTEFCCTSTTTTTPPLKDIFMWETNVRASGVRKYPEPMGWVAAMPVQDSADVGSYWSGYNNVFQDGQVKRPRRVDATLGQQAGFMATKSQIDYFHKEACPGGFLPPFVDDYWKGDSLKRHSVEFWSGGFQLFGTCNLNRVLSLDPSRFSKQLLYHTSNNKQHSKKPTNFYKIQDFFGQLYTVKESAKQWLDQNTIPK